MNQPVIPAKAGTHHRKLQEMGPRFRGDDGSDTLRALVAAELTQPVDPRVGDLATKIVERFSGAAQAVLFYGSCLRATSLDGLMLDFYVIVDSYTAAYGGGFLASANRLLPPNVFPFGADGLRAKYAVLDAADFARLTSTATRNPSVWARFAQPSRLVWQRDAAAGEAAIDAIAAAPASLLAAAAPLAGSSPTIRELWTGAFALTYATELRSERAGRGITLFDAAPEWFEAITPPALAAAGIAATIDGDRVTLPAADVPAALRAWQRRRIDGKALSVARLVKASATFDGGLDYLAWKVSRHSGVPLPVKPWQRRWPLLGALVLLPRLLRSGAVR